MRRIIASLLLLPWIVGVACGAASVLAVSSEGSGNPGFFPVLLFASLFTYLYLFVPALPLLALCLWLRWVSPTHALLVGAITGLTVHLSTASSLFFNTELDLGYRMAQLSTTLPTTVAGALVGVLFWFMAFWRSLPKRPGASTGAA